MDDDQSGRRVLVLNRLWQPVNIVGVRRAFSLLCQGNAQIINTTDGSFTTMEFDEWIDFSLENPPSDAQGCIKTVRFRLRVPPVVLLRFFDRVPVKEVRFNRYSVFERDDHVCQYCGREYSESELTLDHVIPREKGGRTSWENIVTSCIYCNSEKANRLPHQAGMRLLRKPARPKSRSFSQIVTEASDLQPDWAHFVRPAK